MTPINGERLSLCVYRISFQPYKSSKWCNLYVYIYDLYVYVNCCFSIQSCHQSRILAVNIRTRLQEIITTHRKSLYINYAPLVNNCVFVDFKLKQIKKSWTTAIQTNFNPYPFRVKYLNSLLVAQYFSDKNQNLTVTVKKINFPYFKFIPKIAFLNNDSFTFSINLVTT